MWDPRTGDVRSIKGVKNDILRRIFDLKIRSIRELRQSYNTQFYKCYPPFNREKRWDGMDWIRLALGKDQWRELGTMVMKFRLHTMLGDSQAIE
jgi:hypothetical protein